MKYVIVKERGCELPILFDPIIDHASVVNEREVLSAGFVSFRTDGVSIDATCWGQSLTLKSTHREEDVAIILKSILG